MSRSRFLCFFFVLLALAAFFSLPMAAAGDAPTAGSDLPIFDISVAEDANRFLDGFSAGVLLVMVGIAILVSLLGYRILQLALSCGGFAGGWLIGMGLFSWLIGANILPELADLPWYVPYIIYAVFGLAGSILAHKLVKFGFFLTAAAGTFLFLGGISSIWKPLVDLIYQEETSLKYLIFMLVIAFIAGILTKWLEKPILIVTTAAAGGMVASFALMVCIGKTDSPILEIVLGALLAIFGILTQFGLFKKKKK